MVGSYKSIFQRKDGKLVIKIDLENEATVEVVIAQYIQGRWRGGGGGGAGVGGGGGEEW